MKQRPKNLKGKKKGTDSKGKGNFAKIPFQKMSLDSMIGSKAKANQKSKGIFTAKRGQ